MKTFCSIAVVFLSVNLCAAVDFSGVKALASRVSDELASVVIFEELEDTSEESAQIVPNGDTFIIKATSPRMASFALGTYLRDIAGAHISWCGTRYSSKWEMPKETLTVKPLYPYAIAYNYCTLAYTMAFWGKDDWQEEIDHLALHGYNVALVTAGLQKVWQLTLSDMGYTPEQIREFIADDAVSAWWHMGNPQSKGDFSKFDVAYPVTNAQIDLDAEYGAWMVSAMREVGIEPIFQSFVGLIPTSTTKEQIENVDGVGIGNVRIFKTGYYAAGQKNPDLIDPTCLGFKKFSEVWNANLKKVYQFPEENPPKFLGGDLFHESNPPSVMTDSEIENCSANVQAYQNAAFPGAIWIIQSWQGSPDWRLRKKLDKNLTLIQYIDQGMQNAGGVNVAYQNEKGEYLPWVWCEDLNFGGNTGMHGGFRRFRNIGNIPVSGPSGDSFVGYGLISEGLETCPSSYEMFNGTFAMPNNEAQNITDIAAWLRDYRMRRYGIAEDIEELKKAHELCTATVWDCAKWQQGTIESIFCAYPSFELSTAAVSTWGPGGGTPYNREELVKAAEYFLKAAKKHPELMALETFKYDFVEIFQQVLADKARDIVAECQSDKKLRNDFRKLIMLLDQMLSCSDEWRLDKKEARLLKVPSGETQNAIAAYRRMITTWTPGSWGNTELSQYAHRSYAGLIKHYYGARWNKFLDVADGKATQEDYKKFIADLAANFGKMDLTTTEMATPTDIDPIATAEAILEMVENRPITWVGKNGVTNTVVPKLALKDNDFVFELGEKHILTINDFSSSGTGKLIIKGEASTLVGSKGNARVTFIDKNSAPYKPLPNSIVYVCTNVSDKNFGIEQTVKVLSTGVARCNMLPLTLGENTVLTREGVKTDWKVSLSELHRMEFTAIVNGKPAYGVDPERFSEIENKVMHKVMITEEGDSADIYLEESIAGIITIYAKSDGTEITNLVIKPAVAHVPETGANYSDFNVAVLEALKTKSNALTLISDYLIAEPLSIKDGLHLTIASGATLFSGVTDALDYNGECEITVKGTLDLGKTRWTFGRDNKLSLYPGARIIGIGDGAGAVEIFGEKHTIWIGDRCIKRPSHNKKVEIIAPIRTSHDVEFWIGKYIDLTLGDITRGKTNDPRVITKSGSGNLQINGRINENVSLEITQDASGHVSYALSAKSGLEVHNHSKHVKVNITSASEDHKIIKADADGKTIYSSQECNWVVNVTEGNAEAQAEDPGKKFESLEEGQAYLLQKLKTDKNAKLWLIGPLKENMPNVEGWQIISGPPGVQMFPK